MLFIAIDVPQRQWKRKKLKIQANKQINRTYEMTEYLGKSPNFFAKYPSCIFNSIFHLANVSLFPGSKWLSQLL
jgi:hypothetical protein